MIRIRIERKTGPESRLSWSEIKEIFADVLLVIFGVWVLGHLILFLIGGWLVIGEPSKPILVVETMMALGIIALGIDRWRAHRRARREVEQGFLASKSQMQTERSCRMRYGLILCLVFVCLMALGCQKQETKAAEYQWQLSPGEAIALAQDDFDDWLSEIDCRSGRLFVRSILCEGASYWSATQGSCPRHFSEILASDSTQTSNSWCVKYGELSWRVYDDSGIVELASPSWSDMEYFKQLAIGRCD